MTRGFISKSHRTFHPGKAVNQRTRFNVTSNPPPNLNTIIRELAKAAKKEGGVVSDKTGNKDLRSIINKCGTVYSNTRGIADDAARFLYNEGIVIMN